MDARMKDARNGWEETHEPSQKGRKCKERKEERTHRKERKGKKRVGEEGTVQKG